MLQPVAPKDCRRCGKSFTPCRPMQAVCGLRCAKAEATASTKARKAQERAKTRARRDAIQTIPQLIRLAQREFNAYIRARDAGKPCICCGRTANDRDLITGSRWDAGHYRSTGSAGHLRFDEDNCHRQLVVCNRHGAGRAVDYRIGLINRIGLAAVEALEADNRVRKWTRGELIDIRARYASKRKELESGQATRP